MLFVAGSVVQLDFMLYDFKLIIILEHYYSTYDDDGS